MDVESAKVVLFPEFLLFDNSFSSLVNENWIGGYMLEELVERFTEIVKV